LGCKWKKKPFRVILKLYYLIMVFSFKSTKHTAVLQKWYISVVTCVLMIYLLCMPSFLGPATIWLIQVNHSPPWYNYYMYSHVTMLSYFVCGLHKTEELKRSNIIRQHSIDLHLAWFCYRAENITNKIPKAQNNVDTKLVL